jgi:hypothetical protein
VADAFFRVEGDLFVPTELTRGPWGPDAQHAGPPAAREVERLDGGDDRHVARITFEILRAVPIAPLRVEARIVRPGRSVEYDEDGPIGRAMQTLLVDERPKR